jgi:hypothetical protein
MRLVLPEPLGLKAELPRMNAGAPAIALSTLPYPGPLCRFFFA